MSEHSPVPPSGLSRVAKCGASLIANASSNTTNEAALEGSTAHWANHERWRGKEVKVGDICPETNLPIDQDMLTYGDLYLDYVRNLGGEVGSEIKVSVPQIHKNCWGTLDFYAYYKTLVIVDYKYGFIPVDPVDCSQLNAYAKGKANDLNLPPDTQIKLVIIQPRVWHKAGRIREYHTTLHSVDKHIEMLRITVEEALSQYVMAKTGSHCIYCVKATTCEALLTASYNAIDVARRDYDIVDFGNKQLAICLDNLEKASQLISIRRKALEEKAVNSIGAGDNVPGYELSPTWSSKIWTKPKEEIKIMGRLLGAELTKEVILTPAAAKKEGVSPEIVDKLSKSVQSGVKLTKQTTNLARLIFSKKAE